MSNEGWTFLDASNALEKCESALQDLYQELDSLIIGLQDFPMSDESFAEISDFIFGDDANCKIGVDDIERCRMYRKAKNEVEFLEATLNFVFSIRKTSDEISSYLEKYINQCENTTKAIDEFAVFVENWIIALD